MVTVVTDPELLRPIENSPETGEENSEARLEELSNLAIDQVDQSVSKSGLDNVFSVDKTAITPNKIRSFEGGQKKQAEQIAKETLFRVEKVLAKTADARMKQVSSSTSSQGNLERMLWAKKGKGVRETIFSKTKSATDSLFLAKSYETFYEQAQVRAEQELKDQFARFEDFQDKYGKSSAWGRFWNGHKRHASRFEAFKEPMRAALSEKLGEVQERIDGMKEGPQAQRVERMADNINRKFNQASADRKAVLWKKINLVLRNSGSLDSIDLIDFDLPESSDQKSLFVEALLSEKLSWVQEKQGLESGFDRKANAQAEAIENAEAQAEYINTKLSLDTYDDIKRSPFLQSKEPAENPVSSAELTAAITTDFENCADENIRPLIKNKITELFRGDVSSSRVTDAIKTRIILGLLNDDWERAKYLSPDTQQKLLRYLKDIHQRAGGEVEDYPPENRIKAFKALDLLKGGINDESEGTFTSETSPEDSLFGSLAKLINEANDFKPTIKTEPDAIVTRINDLQTRIKQSYREDFIMTCRSDVIPAEDFNKIQQEWNKAHTAIQTLSNHARQWKQEHAKNKKQLEAKDELGNRAIRINSLKGELSHAQAELRGIAASHKKTSAEFIHSAGTVEDQKTEIAKLEAEYKAIDEAQVSQLTGQDQLESLLKTITDAQLEQTEKHLKPSKTPKFRSFEEELNHQLRTEFTQQIMASCLKEVIDNDPYAELLKLGVGTRVDLSYIPLNDGESITRPEQINSDAAKHNVFKVVRIIGGNIQLERLGDAGKRPAININGAPSLEGDHLRAQAVEAIQTKEGDHYGPPQNPRAALITNIKLAA